MSHDLVRAAQDGLVERLDADALAEAAAAQPDLFRGLEKPVAVVRAVRTYCHTGKAITSDEQRMKAVAVLAAAGFSVRAICRQTGESRNTVSAAIAELEKLGKLEPYREVVGRRLAELVGDQMEVVGDLLAKPKRTEAEVADLKAGWVGVGVGLTHMGAARPVQVQHQHLVQVSGPDPVRQYLEAVAAAAGSPSAMQADGSAGKPLVLNAEVVGDASPDSSGAGPGPHGASAPPVVQGPGPHHEGAPPVEAAGAGGGSKARAAVPGSMGHVDRILGTDRP